MDQNEKIVSLSFIIAGLIVWFAMGRFFQEMMTVASFRDPLWNTFMPLSRILGLAVGVGVTAYLFKAVRPHAFAMDVVAELRKVTFPSFDEVRAATIVTIILVIIITTLLGVFDYLWSGVTSLIYKA